MNGSLEVSSDVQEDRDEADDDFASPAPGMSQKNVNDVFASLYTVLN